MSEISKKLGVTDFVSEIKRVVNYPDFEKLAHVIQHGLQRFIFKNIEGESTEANNLHQRKIGVTERPRSLNPGKAMTMAIRPIICVFYYLARIEV